MPNRSVLGGSPLGLIGLKSSPNSAGLSTFPIDKSRNIVVAQYNQSRAGTLFTGKRRLRAWPKIDKLPTISGVDGKNYTDYLGTSKSRKELQADFEKEDLNLHSNSIYDTSILNIVEKLANTKAELRPQDFAYMKNVGVYPNNRLMIARRFGAPQPDNIMIKRGASEVGCFAVLMQYLPEGEDFLSISFGEEWTESEADFAGILNSVGTDIGISNLGGIAGAASNLVPLPGFTEIFQRAFLSKLGLLEESAANQIPAGNPNLIKEAKRRKVIGYGEAGSGLNCSVDIKFSCEYELKYISGIDPTIVWIDLISNITRFATSESNTYGVKSDVAAKLISWANNPSQLIRDIVNGIKDAVTSIAEKVNELIRKIYDAATAAIEADGGDNDKSGEKGADEDEFKEAKDAKKLNEGLLASINTLGNKVTSGLILKYRVKVIGIINALAGLPSTPWHVTLGNPLRPIFCAGDMLTTSVTLKLGPQLAFNDLPSSITAEFTLKNARPWGLQEIMSKFNSGYVRVVDNQKSFYETDGTVTESGNDFVLEPMGILAGDIEFVTSGTSGTSGSGSTASATTGPGGNSGSSGKPSSPGAAAATNTGTNINQNNSSPSGTTQTTSTGQVQVISGSASESKSYSVNGKLDKGEELNKDPNLPAITKTK